LEKIEGPLDRERNSISMGKSYENQLQNSDSAVHMDSNLFFHPI